DDPSLRMATPETVRALTPAAVRSYYTRVFRPDLATIVVIGKVTSAAARAAIEKYFGAWTASGPPPGIDLPRAPPNGPGTVTVPDQSRVQDRVVLAQTLALTRSDPDYYPLQLGNAVLGGSSMPRGSASICARTQASCTRCSRCCRRAGPAVFTSSS